MASVHLRLSKEMVAQASYLEKQLGFSSIQEFIRDSLRRAIEDYEKKLLVRKLKLLQGNAMPKKSPLQKEKWFKEYLNKNPSEIFREFNL